MRLHLALTSAAVLSLALAGCEDRDAAADPSPDVSEAVDAAPDPAAQSAIVAEPARPAGEFVAMAAMANQFEIESSQLALTKGVEPTVREYAQAMITDHTQMRERMGQAIPAAGLQVPAAGLTGEFEEWMQDLRGTASADDFSSEYIDHQISAHERSVNLFSAYAQGGDNPQLRQLASEALPTLRAHLERARALDTRDVATTAPGASGLPGTAAPN